MKKILSVSFLLFYASLVNAQIGYQVSLLNSATGVPRANENVKVKIEITNSDNKVICSEEKNATSNDFGVLSLSVGNDKVFEDVDWSKAPFYVSATVDDILIGKSQLLSVPIAEVAKTIVGVSREVLEGTWSISIPAEDYWYKISFSFNDNSSGKATALDSSDKGPGTYDFIIIGKTIWLLDKYGLSELLYHNGKIYSEQGLLSRQQTIN